MAQFHTVPHQNGACEIVRILDQRVLKKWSRDNPLAFEQSIVWLEPLTGLDFVRVAVTRRARGRRGPLLCGNDYLLLGYSKLTSDAPRDAETGGYVRRLFYLRPDDSLLNMNQFPAGAVDPRTVLPGEPGQPPNVAEWDRGYPHYMCRSQLGLAIPAPETVTATAVGT